MAAPRVSGPALVAVAVCLLCYVAGWRGTDWAAQIYRVGQVARYGLSDWDAGWYGGNYPLNYSLFYPLAAAYFGLWPLAALSCAGAAFSFDRLISADASSRPAASWYFAISTVVEVAIGQLPTLAGEALALGCVLCFAHRRPPDARPSSRRRPALYLGGGLVLAVLTGLTTPVAGSFLALALLAMAVVDLKRSPRRAIVEVGASAVAMASAAALPLLFPGPGYFPFGSGDLVVVLAICALLASPVLATPNALRAGALLYAAVSIALFIVPTQMGDNDARLGAYIGVPLVLYYLLRRYHLPRGAGLRRGGSDGGGRSRQQGAYGAATTMAVALVSTSLVVWHWGPIVEALGGPADGASSVAAFYQPLIRELDGLSGGKPVRVEVPPTQDHWESAYVAPAFGLARGWERQLDVAYDGIFYQSGTLEASTYRSWLLANGVSYIALPNAPLDYSATAEAALLRSGAVPRLQLLWRTASWQLWRVLGSPGLASGWATVIALRPKTVVIHFSRPGVSVVKLRWTPYWSLSGPQPQACIVRAPGGWTEVRTAYPGHVQLRVAVFGADHGNCKSAGEVGGDGS